MPLLDYVDGGVGRDRPRQPLRLLLHLDDVGDRRSSLDKLRALQRVLPSLVTLSWLTWKIMPPNPGGKVGQLDTVLVELLE